MSNITITKKDYIWSFFAQFFSIGAGVITLPIILRHLTSEEIGLNYLLLTIGAMVSLFDFGFAPQFGRNISYIFGGAQELKKEGIVVSENSDINYNLLAEVIHVAKIVYIILSLVVFLLMLTLGTWYIYIITEGFIKVDNTLLIWIIYSISVYFNLYFVYYSSLLMGRGKVMEAKKAMIVSKSVYIILTFGLVMIGWGLIGVVIANLASPFINYYLSHRYFYDNETKRQISQAIKIKEREKELFFTIWHNSMKLGLVFVGSYCISKLSMFLAGLYLSLEDIASYGLMIQLVGVISSVASVFFNSNMAKFSELRIKNDKKQLFNIFASTMNIYYCLFILGIILFIYLGPWALEEIGSKTILPSTLIIFIYSVISLFEFNHSNFATFIITGNKIPFVESSLICGVVIVIGSYLSLEFTTLGILGLVVVQGITQAAYSNWKWPYVVCREFKTGFIDFLKIGFKLNINKILNYHG